MAKKVLPIAEKSLSPSGIWKIERYGRHEDGKWTEISNDGNDHRLMFFIFKNMCLSLQHGQVLVDHISLITENVRVLAKYESLGIIVIKEKVRTKKLRLKFSGIGFYPGVMMIKQCIMKLKPFVCIQDITPEPGDYKEERRRSEYLSAITTQECRTMKSKHGCGAKSTSISLSEQISNLLNKQIPDFHADNKDICSLYPIQDIVESCILDSDFPSFVAQVHHILTNKLKK